MSTCTVVLFVSSPPLCISPYQKDIHKHIHTPIRQTNKEHDIRFTGVITGKAGAKVEGQTRHLGLRVLPFDQVEVGGVGGFMKVGVG